MNKIVSKLGAIKHKEIILAVLAVVIMMIIYFSTFSGSKSKAETPEATSDYCTTMCRKIESVVSSMDGAGKAQAVINWSSSVEIVLAQNVTENGNSSSSQVASSSGTPIILKEIYPRAIGVIIVCEGGNNAKIKVDIIMAISVLMDIPADKVLVFGMKK